MKDRDVSHMNITNLITNMKSLKKQQIWSMAFLAALAAMFIVEIIAIVSVIRLKMLPGFLIVVWYWFFWYMMR